MAGLICLPRFPYFFNILIKSPFNILSWNKVNKQTSLFKPIQCNSLKYIKKKLGTKLYCFIIIHLLLISINDWVAGHMSGQIMEWIDYNKGVCCFWATFEATLELWWRHSRSEQCCHCKLIMKRIVIPHEVIKIPIIVNIFKPLKW